MNKLEEIKSILRPEEIDELRNLLDQLQSNFSVRDKDLNRILTDCKTRLSLLEKRTSEIKAMVLAL